MRIVDEQGRDVKQGEVGEIYLRGPLLSDFTYNNDDAKRREIALGDLVTVGDVGYQDRDGYLFLCDRKRDMIISGWREHLSGRDRICADPDAGRAPAYSANPPGADAMTRTPALRSATSLPTASTSPAHSRPSREPVPKSLPCGWPEATMRSARLRLDARTRIKTSFGAGAGRGTSWTATPLSPTTAAFMTSPG